MPFRSRNQEKAAFARMQNQSGSNVLVPSKGPERLTPSEAAVRWYPQAGKIDSNGQMDKLIGMVEADRSIDSTKKMRRLLFMNSLTHAKDFEKGFSGNLTGARADLKKAWGQYKKKAPEPAQ